MKKVGVIINPHSRGVKKMDVSPLEHFERISEGYADIRVTNSVAEIDPVVKEFKKRGTPYIAICGGDGTCHQVLSRIINIYKKSDVPPILHLRAGTMNTMPRTINLKGTPDRLLKKMISILKENGSPRVFYRDTIRIGDSYCFIFGTGMVANFLDAYYQGKGTGLKKAVKTIMRIIKGSLFGTEVGRLFDRLDCRVIVDGVQVPHRDFIAVIAATVDDIGIGFKPLYRAYEKEGTFHVIAAGCSPSTFVKNIWKIRKGIPVKHPYVFDTIGKKVVIKSDKKMLYTMDGDLYEANGALTIETGPQIRLVYV